MRAPGELPFFLFITFVEGGDLPMHETNRMDNWPRAWLAMRVVGRPCLLMEKQEIG